MKRILSLILAAIMSFSSSFAITNITDYNSIGEKLKKYNIIQGQDNGDLQAFSKLTREQAIVILIRMLGKEEMAKSTNIKTNFKDVPSNNFYAPYISYAKLINLTNGISENEFGFEKQVSTKEIATYFLRILNHSADWQKEDIMQKAKDLGILKNVSSAENESIIRGEVFVMLDNTIHLIPKGEKLTLAQKLGFEKIEEIDATKPQVKPDYPKDAMEVVNVSVKNLKEIEVEFTNEIDKTTLKHAFRVDGGDVGQIISTILDDARTVRITTEKPMISNKKYILNISSLFSTDGVKVETIKKDFKAVDVETPILEEVRIVGPRSLQLIFNEPINYSISNNKRVMVKVGNTEIRSIIKKNPDERIIDVNLATDMQNNTVYKVEVLGFLDYATYSLIYTEKDIEYHKIEDRPYALIEKATPEYVVVKFSRPVSGFTIDNFYHEYQVYRPMAVYLNMEDYEKRQHKLSNNFSNHKVERLVLQFADANTFESNPKGQYPLSGNERFYIINEFGGKIVTDEWGNKLQNFSTNLNVQINNEKPEVLSVSVLDEKRIQIIFNKPVDAKTNNFEFYNVDGTKINVSTKIEKSKGDKVILAINYPKFDGREITFIVKDIVDTTINRNKMNFDYKKTLKFTDQTFDGVDEVILNEVQGGGVISVAYNENVDEKTATDTTNYQLQFGKSDFEPLNAIATMRNGKIVEFEISQHLFDRIHGKKNIGLVISDGVKDLNGNGFKVFSRTFDIKQTGTSTGFDEDKMPTLEKDINGQYIRTTFTSHLNSDYGLRGEEQFSVTLNGNEQEIAYAEFDDDRNQIIKVYLAKDVPSDAKGLKIRVKPLAIIDSGLYNDKNIVCNTDYVEVIDKIPPKLIRFKSDDLIPEILYDIDEHSIILKFNEEMVGSLRYIPKDVVALSYDFTKAMYNVEGDNLVVIDDVVRENDNTFKVVLKVEEKNEEKLKTAILDYISNATEDFKENGKKYYRIFNIRLDNSQAMDNNYNKLDEKLNEFFGVYLEQK